MSALPFRTWGVAEPDVAYDTQNDIDWARIVTDLRPRLLQLARGILGDEHGAEDALQDGLLRARSGAHRIRDARSVHAWIRTIVRRAAIDRLRRSSCRPENSAVQLDESVHLARSSSRRYPRADTVAELSDEISRLPPTLRSALLLCSSGHDLTAIADVEGVSYGAAKTRISRARAQLRRSIIWGEPNPLPNGFGE